MTAVVRELQPPTSAPVSPIIATSGVALTIYADALDDLERTRISTQNRLRSLRQVKGMEGTREYGRMAALVETFALAEHDTQLLLQGALRKHPLGPWVQSTVGVGLKQGARLLAAIGDPYWHVREERPRTVSELWAYCGFHVIHSLSETHTGSDGVGSRNGSNPGQARPDTHPGSAGVAPAHARGQQANWSDTARMRAWLIAESCMKQRTSPYRKVYEDGRTKYADSTHNAPCKRCGPSGKPALVGSELSDGHKHARALRLVAKAVLRDLWCESKRLHERAS